MNNEYICHTKQGSWKFYADSDIDAMRLALFFCWRDGEDFIKIEYGGFAKHRTMRICLIDDNNNIQTL